MKKAALLVFPIVFMLLFQTTGFSVYAAEKSSTSKYNIQFEKLAGTEDAKEFNSYRNELLSYFNQQIKKERNLKTLKKSDVDFDNEKLVHGYKVWGDFTDYSIKTTYDNVMKTLSKQNYNWYISIKTEKTAVFAIICPADLKTSDKDFCFGDNDEWCVTWCDVSKSTGSEGSSTISAINDYALFDGAEANLNKFIKYKKTDDIKVVYVNLGNPKTDYHFYARCGIVFVNDTANYIYTLGFEIYPDNLIDKTPESIKILLNNSLSDLYNNRIKSIWGCKDVKKLYDYDYIMSLIIIYEEYAFC